MINTAINLTPLFQAMTLPEFEVWNKHNHELFAKYTDLQIDINEVIYDEEVEIAAEYFYSDLLENA